MSVVRTCVAAATVFFCSAAPAEPVSTSSLQPLLQAAEASAPRRVIVGVALGEAVHPEGALDAAQVFARRARIAVAQDEVTDLIRRLGGRVLSRYSYLPYLSAELDAAALDQLMASPLVASVSADRLRQPTLLRSTALTGAEVAWRAGLTGAGWTVALPDTGVDSTHPFLADKVIAEACFSSTFAGNATQVATVSLCPRGTSQSVAAGAGLNCDPTFADCDHGTHVAGIIAGRNGRDGLSGIAPDASLIALQIYSRKADGSGIGAWDSDLLRALEHVYSLSVQHRIAAVNLSLAGSDIYADQSTCDAEHPALRDAVELLRSVDIATVAAAGNDAATDALAAPACLSAVISVGASCEAGPDDSFCTGGVDSIATYSNVSSLLSLLAPGSYITSSIPGNSYETLSGTSLAAPHVAAAIALLRQQSPLLTVDYALRTLLDSAAPIDDRRSGGTITGLPMLDLRGVGEMSVTAAEGAAPEKWNGAGGAETSPRTASVTPMTVPKMAAETAASSGNHSDGETSREYGSSTTLLAEATDVVTGEGHTCALASTGEALCWGDNSSGQLGDGTTTPRLTAVGVRGLSSDVAAIVAGGNHSCALTNGGAVKCWGSNYYGELGDGTTVKQVTPVDVVGMSSGIEAIAAGRYHTCALTAAGGVKCWGSNYYGQLGDGTKTDRDTPTDVVGLPSGAVAIAANEAHSCALMAGGGVKCWGLNVYGELGDGTTTDRTTPVDVVGLSAAASAIAVGTGHTCALTSGGGVSCWGFNYYGQLGDGTTTARHTPVEVVGLSSGVQAIAAGYAHTCAITVGGGARCWGMGWRLGAGTTTPQSVPVDVAGLDSGMSAIATSTDHSCALTAVGGLKCWGLNAYGQLGDGTRELRLIPVDVISFADGAGDTMPDDFGFNPQTVVPLNSVRTSEAITPRSYDSPALVAIDSGEYSIGCTDSFSASFGTISPGQSVCVRHTASSAAATTVTTTLTIGGVSGKFSSSTTVASVEAAIDVASGGYHHCAITVSGAAKCWGWNVSGQLGDGTTMDRAVPVDVVGLSSGVAVIAVGSYHSCALTTGGAVKCWGNGGDGQLGIGTFVPYRPTPGNVVGLSSGATAIAAGNLHSCAAAVGGVKCWGRNSEGQLGDGSTTLRYAPVDVVNFGGPAIGVAAGISHSCALTSGGGVKCWGSGFLGDGTTEQRLTPVDVVGLSSGVTAISVWGHTCALTAEGGVKCWGGNYYGQLGDGTTTDRLVPVDVVGLSSGVQAITAGYMHTCALTIAGGVKCWGLSYGTTPVDATGLSSGVIAISEKCAVTSGGGVRCGDWNVAGFAPPDTVPDVFGFAAQTDSVAGATLISETITAKGYDSTTSIAVADGEYSIGCTGSFTAAAGYLSPGQSVCVRHTAAGIPGATVTTTLTIGGVSGGFSSTTAAPGQFALAVIRNGGGIVSSDPAGIDCGNTCSASYPASTEVMLTATPAVESTFTGWSGICTGTSTCAVSMTEARSVTATFIGTPATTEKISALYIAFFTRAADFEGLGFWKAVAWDSALDDRTLMRLMAGGFANHPSFAAIYGALDDSAYVDAIYVNVGGKPADAAGKAYWLGLLGSGQISRSDFVADFTYGLLEITEQTLQELVDSRQITEAERKDALARKYRMQNKTDVAIAFLDALGPASNLLPTTDPLDPVSLEQDPAYRAAQNIIREVTEDPATMEAPLTYLAGDPTIDEINQLFGP